MAFDAYFHLPEIPGEATRAGYEEQIKLESYSFGGSNTASIDTGGGGAGTARSSVTPIRMKKLCDKASPMLFQACLRLDHHPEATLTVVKSGGGEDVPFVVVAMRDVVISNFNQSGGGEEEVVAEDFDVSYGAIEVTYTGQADTGAFSDTTVGSWDVRTATV